MDDDDWDETTPSYAHMYNNIILFIIGIISCFCLVLC